MIGDLLLSIKTWFKELVCIHDYKGVKAFGSHNNYIMCTKCGRVKKG